MDEIENRNNSNNDYNKINKHVFIPLLIGLSTAGLVSGLNPLYAIIENDQRPLDFLVFVTPIIFYVTNMRFTIGNLIHLGSHKEKTNQIWRASWALMIFQHSTMIFLGGFTGETTQELFFYILGALLVIDIVWVVVSIIIDDKNNDDDAPHYGWAAINTFSVVMILVVIFVTPYDLTEYGGLMILFFTFIAVAIIDFAIIGSRHSKYLKGEKQT